MLVVEIQDAEDNKNDLRRLDNLNDTYCHYYQSLTLLMTYQRDVKFIRKINPINDRFIFEIVRYAQKCSF